MDSAYIDLIKMVLSEFLVVNFDLVKTNKDLEVLHLCLEELNSISKEGSSGVLIAHGFHKELSVQDFPLRGNAVYLHVKRRK